MTDPYTDTEPGGDADIGRLVRRAYWAPVDIETAARHLWRLHRVATAPAPVRGARRTLVSVLAAVLLFATAGTAVALSTSSVPGDSLYTVKRGAERLHLLVSFAPESDARLHLRFARSRIGEAQSVAATRPEIVPDLLSEIVASVDHATTVGGSNLADEVEIVRLEASTALSSLGSGLDGEVAASVDQAVRALGGEAVAAGSAPEQRSDAVVAPQRDDGEPPAPASDAPAAARHPAPDRTAPASPATSPATAAPGEDAAPEEDGDGLVAVTGDPGDAGGDADEEAPPDATTGHQDAGGRAAPSPPPAPPAPDPAELAAETMETVERLEGLLQWP